MKKTTGGFMQEIAEIIADDMAEKIDAYILKNEKLIQEIREVLVEDIDVISEEEVLEKTLKIANKLEGIEFTPYIDKTIQRKFYCKFDGLVTVKEEEQTEGDKKTFYYTKWYKKGGVSYFIGYLTIGMIKRLMRRSLKDGCDAIMEMIKSMQKGEEEEKVGKRGKKEA